MTVPATTVSLPRSPQSGSGVDKPVERLPSGTASLKGSGVGAGVGVGIGVGVGSGADVGSGGAVAARATVGTLAGAATASDTESRPTMNHQIRSPMPTTAAAALTTRSKRALLDTGVEARGKFPRVVGPQWPLPGCD